MSNQIVNTSRDEQIPLGSFLSHYGISRTTAWRWRKQGLPTLRVGAKIFCRVRDFEAFLVQMDVKSRGPAKTKQAP